MSVLARRPRWSRRNKRALTDTVNRQPQKGIAQRPRRYAVEEQVASLKVDLRRSPKVSTRLPDCALRKSGRGC